MLGMSPYCRKALRRPALSARGRRAGRVSAASTGGSAVASVNGALVLGLPGEPRRRLLRAQLTEVSEGFYSGGAGEESAGAGLAMSHTLRAWLCPHSLAGRCGGLSVRAKSAALQHSLAFRGRDPPRNVWKACATERS